MSLFNKIFKKSISIVIVLLFFTNDISYALSPSPGSGVVATKTSMDKMGKDLFTKKYGPSPVDFTSEENPEDDICITIPQLKRAYAAFKENKTVKISYDLFAPKVPHGAGYMVVSGLEVALADIRERVFSKKYIDILRLKNIFSEDFLNYLSKFVFEGDVDAVPEGMVVTAGVPIIRIRASEAEIALLEGLLKNRIGFATNIATKTARIVQAANGDFVEDKRLKKQRTVVEFGLRRAQGKSAPLASRSAIVGGAAATSNVRAASLYNLELTGTMAHLFVQKSSPDKEIDSFRMYAGAFPDSSIFLIDTYDTLEGARNASIVAKEMERSDHKLVGVRLDSGDLVKLSQGVRKILDDAGLQYVKIFASDNLDEEEITSLISHGALIDAFGVGTSLITGGKEPILGLELQPSYGDNVFKITGKDGKISRYIKTPENSRMLNISKGETIEEALMPYWRKGERISGENKTSEARERTIKSLASLPDCVRSLKNVQNIEIQKQVVVNLETDALIVVDAQPTFMPGGGLPVADGDKIMPKVRQLMDLFPKKNRFATRDQHPIGHISLASSYIGSMSILTYDMVKDWTEDDNRIGPNAKFTLSDLKEYLKEVGRQILWPDHGIEGTAESNLHSAIDKSEFEEVLVKGTNPKVDSYSGFFDNMKNPTGLADKIRNRGFKRVFVVGLATDYCAGWTAEGARKEGFEVVFIDDAARSVCFPEGSVENMYNSFKEKKISFVPETDSLVLAGGNTVEIKSQEIIKNIKHPVSTTKEERTALTEDMYHLTMGQSFFKAGIHGQQATFDYFYRKAPYGRDSIIVSGIKNFVDGLRRFKFTEKNIEYLRSLHVFSEDYLQYLKNFEFHGTIDAMEEGSVAFPMEPIIRVRGTIFEAMIIESFLLNIMNFNSLEATWADEKRKSSPGKILIEDLLSFAQGRAHMHASRDAYLGGIDATTNLEAHARYGIPLDIDIEEGEGLDKYFITGGSQSSLGGVYKLAVFDGKATIKLSNNPSKTSLPDDKMVFEIVNAQGDVLRRTIAGADERFALNTGERAIPRLKTIVRLGRFIYEEPALERIREFKENDTGRYKNIHSSELSKSLASLQSELITNVKNRDRNEPTFANINIMGPRDLDYRFLPGNDLRAEFDQYNNLNDHFNNWKNFKPYLANLKAKGITKVYLTGLNTDPLRYAYLGEIVDYLKKEGFYVGLRTDGVLAKEKTDIINKFDTVSYTILTLSPDTLEKIAGKRYMIDWDYILKNTTTKKRAAIVVTRENKNEILDIIKFLSFYKDISYIQVRKVATDTREGLLKEDMRVFDEFYEEVAAKYPKIGSFEMAPIFGIEGKDVVFWNTVGTSINSWNYFTNGVYSDNYFIIEGYLENKYKTAVSDLHTKARYYNPKGYPDRFPVSDERVSWGVPFPKYSPRYYVSHEVIEADRTKVQRGYADSEDISRVELPLQSHEGNILYKNGFPLNPKGRTGLVGRGNLGKWGPNYAVDPIITRYNEITEQYEMLAVQREDSDKLSIPGVILLDGEKPFDAIRRRLSIKIGQDVPMDGAVRLYKGYVDDPRNTDNAWLETEVFHLNLPYDLTKTFALQNKFGKWAEWMPLTTENTNQMYANHGEFVRLALSRLQPAEPRADRPEDTRDALKRLLDPDKPAVVVFDVHGVLLKGTWKNELMEVYKKLVGEYPTQEWMERYVLNKPDEDVLQTFCEKSGKSKEVVRGVMYSVKNKLREASMPEAMPGALEFIRALKRENIPIVIMSGTRKDLMHRQLEKRGFLDYVDEDDLLGGPESPKAKYSRGDVLKEIQSLYPHHQIVLCDDWIYGIAAVKKLGGVSLGLGQGKGAELAVNKKRLLEEGIDFPLDGWNRWEIVYQALAEHNKKVLNIARFGHTIARTKAPPEYGKRPHVAANKVSWDIKFPGYRPKDVIAQVVLDNDYSKGLEEKWADPVDFNKVLEDIAKGRREPIVSYEGPVRFDKKTGLPINPRGRTGIKNRGLLGKYGPNHAADPVVTRVNSSTGEYEVLLIQRSDNGAWATPGGMVNREMTGDKFTLENTLDTAVRELQEETGVILDKSDIEKAASVYKGYVDDRRNTDNAWMETETWHFHIEDSDRAMKMIPKGNSDAKEARWFPIDKMPVICQCHDAIMNTIIQKIERADATSHNKLRVAMAQINCVMGDMELNRQKILDCIKRAKEGGADIVVFPELAITGYSPQDLVYRKNFIRDNLATLNSIIGEVKGITAIIGFIDIDDDGRLFNAAAIVSDGELKGVYRKKELPNYGVFDEVRYFKKGGGSEIYDLGGIPFGVNICEDVWVDDDSIYLKQSEKGARVIFNISASPYYMNKLKVREDLVRKRIMQTGAFVIYTNLVGGQDDVVYDGGSFVMGPDGKILAQCARNEEDLVILDLDLTQAGNRKNGEINAVHIERHNVSKERKLVEPKLIKEPSNELKTIYDTLVLGTRDYIRKNGFKKVVIGLSGGIDSALVAAIAVDAIGRENVVGISMPSRYNSQETQSDAKKLAEMLGIEFKEIPIESVYGVFLSTLGADKDYAALPFGVAEENLQARIRGAMLMSQSNKLGYMVLTTGNKSESAVGYATLYGDMAGGFAPIQDVYKTKVFELARYVNSRGKELIPESTITRPPSAELRDGQKDTDSLPPYEILDGILKAYIERNESVAQMAVKWDKATVEKVVHMVDKNEYKRRQAAPGIKITERALGKDWRLPITNRYRDTSAKENIPAPTIPEVKLADNERLAIRETVNLFRAERVKILSPQSIDLTRSVKETIERIRQINGEDNFSYKPYTEENLKAYLENKEKGEKLIVIAMPGLSQFIQRLLNENPMLFKDVRVLTVDMPASYANENEKTQYQARTLIVAILVRLFDKKDKEAGTSSTEIFLKSMLSDYFDGDIKQVNEFMDNLGVSEQEAFIDRIIARVLYFLGKILRFSEIQEKERKMMDEFLTYA